MAPSSESDRLKMVDVSERVAILENERRHTGDALNKLSGKIETLTVVVADLDGSVRDLRNDRKWVAMIASFVGGSIVFVSNFFFSKR